MCSTVLVRYRYHRITHLEAGSRRMAEQDCNVLSAPIFASLRLLISQQIDRCIWAGSCSRISGFADADQWELPTTFSGSRSRVLRARRLPRLVRCWRLRAEVPARSCWGATSCPCSRQTTSASGAALICSPDLIAATRCEKSFGRRKSKRGGKACCTVHQSHGARRRGGLRPTGQSRTLNP
jgi:hypothetical protein